jgi:hypothetical protein
VKTSLLAAAFAFTLPFGPILAQEGAPNTNLSDKDGSLSDKLNSSNGVITPEDNVDPGIRKPAPAEGAMPVMPPPGSPGGQQDVEPK